VKDELRRALERIELSEEHEARVRSWDIVRTAYAEREPAPRARRLWRPALVAAVAVAVVAGAFSPPGRALIDSVREAIGVEESAPALFRLPDGGRALVTSSRGVWVVRPDGSRRLLGRYREASWSPFGRFVVAARANELAALDPRTGDLRWSLARSGVRHPRWGGTQTDTRIAYLRGPTLRVVAGDATGDRLLARDAATVAPAWRPGAGHVLVYATRGSGVRAVASDSGRTLWSVPPRGRVVALEWSHDGRRLLVRGPRSLRILDADGRLLLEPLAGSPAAPVVAAALAPDGRSLAFVQRAAGRSTLWIVPRLRPDDSAARRVFAGAGRFTDVAWSPDARWLLLGWRDADQWLFLRSSGVRRLEAVSSISRQFRGAGFPRLEGWCCAGAR
jgi:hypothetical protein